MYPSLSFVEWFLLATSLPSHPTDVICACLCCFSAAKTVRLVRREALIGRREWSVAKVSWEAVAFKVYVPGVQAAGDVSFEVSNEVMRGSN